MDLSANEREEALQVFAAEAQEILVKMEGELTALEARPDDAEMLDGLSQSLGELEGSAGRASFETVLELTRHLASLVARLRALAAPIGPEHLRLLQRTLAVFVESTSDCVTGVSVPRPEVAALRDELAGAAPSPAARAPGTAHASIDLALRSVVHRVVLEDEGEGEEPAQR